jgi:hypothetical protein
MWWTWLATAFAACPEVAAQPDSVARAVDDAFRAYAAQDSAAYVEAWLRGEVAVACAPVALEPDVVGRLLALRAVHADVMGQPDAAGRAWAAARRVGGDAVLPEGLPVDPSRFPVPAEDWPQPLTLPEAAGFTWRVDGRDVPVLYPGRPSLVQRLNTDGVWWSGVVEEVSAIPMPPASSDPETEPGLLSARGYSFVRVPAGTFRQGSPLRERGRDSDEAQREVTLTRDVWIGATEVPDHLWRAARGEPSLVRDRTPARGAPFVEVVAFCNRLSELEGPRPGLSDRRGQHRRRPRRPWVPPPDGGRMGARGAPRRVVADIGWRPRRVRLAPQELGGSPPRRRREAAGRLGAVRPHRQRPGVGVRSV